MQTDNMVAALSHISDGLTPDPLKTWIPAIKTQLRWWMLLSIANFCTNTGIRPIYSKSRAIARKPPDAACFCNLLRVPKD